LKAQKQSLDEKVGLGGRNNGELKRHLWCGQKKWMWCAHTGLSSRESITSTFVMPIPACTTVHSSSFHVPGRISTSQGKQYSTNTDYVRQTGLYVK